MFWQIFSSLLQSDQMLDIFKSDFRLQKYISGRYAFLATDSSRAGNINHFLPTVNPELSLCLAGTGIVASIPLIFFTIAAVNLPMNVLGFCQYISPILTLLLGILFFNERFGWAELFPLLFIWSGIAAFLLAEVREHRKAH